MEKSLQISKFADMGNMSSMIFGMMDDGCGDIAAPQPVGVSTSGHSRTWKATLDGKTVCIKSLKEEYIGNPVYEGLLEKEYEIGSSAEHPSICRTLDFRRIDGLGNCVVTEWIEGETLAEAVQNGEMTPALARKVILELCDALDALHHRQIVHRDIKPANIMLTANGRNVKLIDFGLADTDTHARYKIAAGTESYAAPEQIEGQRLDERSDIYSLGRVIGEIASAIRPAERRGPRYGKGHLRSAAGRRSSRFWKKIAALCTAEDIGHRISDAGALKREILRRERRGRQIPLIAAAVLAAAAVAAYLLTPYMERAVERHRMDSLVREVTEEILY